MDLGFGDVMEVLDIILYLWQVIIVEDRVYESPIQGEGFSYISLGVSIYPSIEVPRFQLVYEGFLSRTLCHVYRGE